MWVLIETPLREPLMATLGGLLTSPLFMVLLSLPTLWSPSGPSAWDQESFPVLFTAQLQAEMLFIDQSKMMENDWCITLRPGDA